MSNRRSLWIKMDIGKYITALYGLENVLEGLRADNEEFDVGYQEKIINLMKEGLQKAKEEIEYTEKLIKGEYPL